MAAAKIRIAVLVSGGGTNLQAILDAQKSGIINSGEVVLVISSKEKAFALARAQEAGIKTEVLEPAHYPTQRAFEARLKAVLEENAIRLIVLAGFMTILSGDFTRDYPKRIINVHPSLIPSFCGKGFYGLKVHEAALACGVKVTGATVHFVNEIPDGGEILLQKAVEVDEGETPKSLQQKVMRRAEWIILPEAVESVAAELSRKEGNHSECV